MLLGDQSDFIVRFLVNVIDLIGLLLQDIGKVINLKTIIDNGNVDNSFSLINDLIDVLLLLLLSFLNVSILDSGVS